MSRVVLAFAVLAPLATAARSPVDGPMRLVVHPDPRAAAMDRPPPTFEVPFGRSTEIRDREWGGPIEGASVEVLGGPPNVRVQVQYETSVSILNPKQYGDAGYRMQLPSPMLAFEGPRLDLRDWRHFTSPWTDLERDEEGRYRVGALGEAERRRFPPVDREELLDAVHAAGGFAWADLVRDVAGPHDFPATVGPSAIRLRLLYGDPEVAFVVEFDVFSGC